MTRPVLRPPGAGAEPQQPQSAVVPEPPPTPDPEQQADSQRPSQRHVSVLDQQQSGQAQTASGAISPLHWFGGALLLIALIVVFVLPELVDPSADQDTRQAHPVPAATTPLATQAIPGSPANTPPPTAPTPSGQQQQLAKQLLSQVLSLRATLEAENVEHWAGNDYRQLLSMADQAARQFSKARYLDAVTSYQRVLTGLKALHASKPERLARALQLGQEALEQDQSMVASQHYGTALAINPENAEAQAGKQRAQNLDQVNQLYQQALQSSQQGEPEKAREALQQAITLDPQHQDARALLAKLDEEIREAQVQQLIAAAEEALQRGRLSTARSLLRDLRKLDPQTREIPDLSRRIDQRAQQLGVKRIRRQAEQAASDEDWQQAAEKYRQALKSNPKLSFARSGLQRAERELQLNQDLDHYLKQPDRLASDSVLRNAKTLLAQLEQLRSPGPKRLEQTRQLDQLIRDAQTEIPLTITSDEHTEVTIYRVIKFGTLKQRQLTLRPGKYTIVGSREGYRDVRKTLRITAQQGPQEIHIQCREAI